ncbi:MAG: undecaprenyldiphospho-muramoylpentapeptide beta-N-acetylglucosaminyltransferase [Desulfuromonadaceae bacterium GWC2_58_13]|nr:MAG: undecaprenyldiphospho-muramoylpentapeptide beta-N-acetylglucosaminyltransferase [Desulfuromonadaceae bacterium GWC2_58_13]
MKMLLAGGGTGGHLFPAVALAQRLLAAEPESKVLFVGTRRGIEAKVLPELGLPLATIDISGLVGKKLVGKLIMGPQLIRSLVQSLRILHKFQPDVVVGVGGYASGPVLLAARLRGYPTLIHEQNAAPGLTNRLLGRWVDRVCTSFSEMDCGFKRSRTVLTGNPLRSGMDDCPPVPSGTPRLLVFGGSRGARAINDAVVAMLPDLARFKEQLAIHHQTGAEDLERIRQGYREAGWEAAEVVPFIDDMAAAYARSHLVICRAGATTLAELTACGRPAILIPYPYAAADHQTANAQSLASRGAALMLPQSDLTPALLARLVGDLLDDRERLLGMAGVSWALGKKGAADRILQECRVIAGVVSEVPANLNLNEEM